MLRVLLVLGRLVRDQRIGARLVGAIHHVKDEFLARNEAVAEAPARFAQEGVDRLDFLALVDDVDGDADVS